jgi:hypothetical protein
MAVEMNWAVLKLALVQLLGLDVPRGTLWNPSRGDGLGAMVCDFALLGNGWCLNALELSRRMLPGLDVPRGTLMGVYRLINDGLEISIKI